jgi:hypothetical protein
MVEVSTAHEAALGQALRAWRDRLTPATVGLPGSRRRRAVGLRREEVAELAGVPLDYLVRLEQGRIGVPSTVVASSLARALRLTANERDELYRLAGFDPPRDGAISDHIPPGLQRVLTRLGETPVAVFAADWQLIWWNRTWSAVLGNPLTVAPEARNLVKARFPVASDRGRVSGWPVVSQNRAASDLSLVADLRRAAARYPGDARLSGLIRRCLDGNQRFAELWVSGGPDRHGGHGEVRSTIRHPGVGEIAVDRNILTDEDTELKAMIYTAEPGSADAAKIDMARAWAAAATAGRYRLP